MTDPVEDAPRRSEPDRYNIMWLDHQRYHADLPTIEMLWAVKKWDDSPDQHIAHAVFDEARHAGRVFEGPVQHRDVAVIARDHDVEIEHAR